MGNIDQLYYQLMRHPDIEVKGLCFVIKYGTASNSSAFELLEQYKQEKWQFI